MKHAGHQLYLCYCEQGTWLKGLSNCPAEHRRTETLVVCSSSAVFRLLSLWRFKHSSFSLSFYLRATELKVNLGQERLVCSGSKKLWALVIQWVQAESFLSKHSPRNSVAHRAAFSPRNKTASKLSGLCPKEPTITTFKTEGSSMKGVGVTQMTARSKLEQNLLPGPSLILGPSDPVSERILALALFSISIVSKAGSLSSSGSGWLKIHSSARSKLLFCQSSNQKSSL